MSDKHNMSRKDVAINAMTAASVLQRMGTGSLARLRRMTENDIAPEFWRLNLPDRKYEIINWITIIKIFAILTDKGDPEKRQQLHDKDTAFGRLLCDGGQASWKASDQPLLSELRLAQLLATRGQSRRESLVRAARALSAKHGPHIKVNVVDIAWAVINPKNSRSIAQAYYRRMDGAVAAEKKGEKNEQQVSANS